MNSMHPMPLPPAIFIMGPTASGKTDLAMALYEHLPVELISVDSALVYRGMDIGTAKPTPMELATVPHRLIDICDPKETYSAENFRRDALHAMAEITAKGRIPLLVGGTMLYFRALQHGLSRLPTSDPVIRVELERRIQQEGSAALHAELVQVDPLAAQRIHANDPQRILRALEVWRITGKPLSQLQQATSGDSMPYRAIKLARSLEQRQVLHQRINQRFLGMLEAGFINEVKRLMARDDLHLDLPSMRAVGYRQMWLHLQGEYDQAEMIQRAQAATRQLAKRQITWLRSEQDVHWLNGTDDQIFKQALQQCAESLQQKNSD